MFDVLNGERFVNLLDGLVLAGEPGKLLIVVARTRDCLFEDGGIRSHAFEAILYDEPRELGRREQMAPNVIEPEVLAEMLQLAKGVSRTAHGITPASRGSLTFRLRSRARHIEQ